MNKDEIEKFKESFGYKGKPKQWQEGFDACLRHWPEPWIDVKDKVPTDQQEVIVRQDPLTNNKNALFAKYNTKTNHFEVLGGTVDGIHLCVTYWSDITHWRPKPETTI